MGNIEILDEGVVVDDNVITGQGLGETIPFALEIVRIMVGDDAATQIMQAICYKDNRY